MYVLSRFVIALNYTNNNLADLYDDESFCEK